MIAELVRYSNQLGVPVGKVREIHIPPEDEALRAVLFSEPFNDHGLVDPDKFVEDWWDTVVDAVPMPDEQSLDDRAWLGIVHEDGVLLVEVAGRPTP